MSVDSATIDSMVSHDLSANPLNSTERGQVLAELLQELRNNKVLLVRVADAICQYRDDVSRSDTAIMRNVESILEGTRAVLGETRTEMRGLLQDATAQQQGVLEQFKTTVNDMQVAKDLIFDGVDKRNQATMDSLVNLQDAALSQLQERHSEAVRAVGIATADSNKVLRHIAQKLANLEQASAGGDWTLLLAGLGDVVLRILENVAGTTKPAEEVYPDTSRASIKKAKKKSKSKPRPPYTLAACPVTLSQDARVVETLLTQSSTKNGKLMRTAFLEAVQQLNAYIQKQHKFRVKTHLINTRLTKAGRKVVRPFPEGSIDMIDQAGHTPSALSFLRNGGNAS